MKLKSLCLFVVAVLGMRSASAGIIWVFNDDSRQWQWEWVNEDEPCEPSPDECCPPGGGGGGGKGGGGGCFTGCLPMGTSSFHGLGGSPGAKGHGGISDGAWDSPAGMPHWWVSEPFLNVWLEDRPMGYQPSRGLRIDLRLRFKNFWGGMNHLDAKQTDIFSFGRGWNCPWRSYAQVDSGINSSVMVFAGNGGAIIYHLGEVQYQTRGTMALVSTNYVLTWPWGGKHTYTYPAASEDSSTTYFLSKIEDAQGNATSFEYFTSNNVVYLAKIIDVDARETTFVYTNAGTYTALVSRVTGPDGLVTELRYDSDATLTNIIDCVGMSSIIKYAADSFGNAYKDVAHLAELITPYCTNKFKWWNAPGNTDDQALHVNEAGVRDHLYYYFKSGNTNLPTQLTNQAPAIAGEFAQSLDTTNSNQRNSFYWAPKVHSQLPASIQTNLPGGTFDPVNLSSNDFRLARQRHWLIATNEYHLYGGNDNEPFVGRTLSFERLPTPDGIQDGQITWYDYAGKPANTNHFEGASMWPRLVAWKLPNGQSRYAYTVRNSLGHPTFTAETYSDGASVLLRTNLFEYSGDGIDLIKHVQVLVASSVQVSSNRYNSSHLVLTNYDALNQVTRYLYDGSNRLTSVTRPSDLVTTNIYDANGRLSSTIAKEGATSFATNSYTWTNGLILTHTDPRGMTITNSWDALGRLTNVAYPDGTTLQRVYDKLDMVRTLDRMGFTNRFEYDNLRQLIRDINAKNSTNTYVYCICGTLESVTDQLGNATSYEYDNQSRLIRLAYPGGSAVTNKYDSMGQVTNRSDTAGVSVTNWYNNHGLLIAATNAFGQLQRTTFDIEDHPVFTADNNNVAVTNVYDDLDRLTSRSYADGGIERFVYSARGMIAYTNQITNMTLYVYDALGRKTAETNGNNEVTQFAYTPAGELRLLTDGKDQTTTWKYDLFGRMTNKIDHASADMFRYGYDANGRLTNRWTPAKGTTKYTYDAVGNLTAVDYAASTDIALSYDALNRLTNMVDAVGTTKYAYTAFGAVNSEDGPWDSDTVSYRYDNGWRRAALGLQQLNASSWAQTYGYDAGGRLEGFTSGAGSFAYSYTGGNAYASTQPDVVYFPTTTQLQYTYDSVGRVQTKRLENQPDEFSIDQFIYGLDLAGQPTNANRVINGNIAYTYDKAGQLKTALAVESTTNRWQERFRYSYDAAGNLQYRTNNALTHTFNVNSLNQLTTVTRSGSFTVAGTTTSAATNVTVNTSNSVLYLDRTFASTNHALSDGTNTFIAIGKDNLGRIDTNIATVYLPATVTFVYDSNGNLTYDGHKALEYDDENQLTWITATNAWRSQFVYDGKMRRRVRREYTWQNSTWVLSNEVRYVYDGNLVIQERDNFNLATVTYTRGNDVSGSLQGAGGIGGLVARTDNAIVSIKPSAAHAYYFSDGNGNITTVINTNQQVVARYLYDPFGAILSMSGPLAEANLYRFSAKEAHPASGLIYYLYRYYDPSLQRWVNRDPFDELGFEHRRSSQAKRPPDGVNLYTFVLNNGVTLVDPFGLHKFGKNCKAQQIKDIKNAIADICKKARAGNCFRCLSSGDQGKMNKFCDDKLKGVDEASIQCDDASTNPDCASRCGDSTPGSRVLHLCFNNINNSNICPGMGCSIIHEATHGVAGESQETKPYGIEKCSGCNIPQGQKVPPGY